mmetsp:Transcript_99222/g.222332  ORF Transcript_99222/g.222332 Transcript_99222/m.222332 type:complete len:219 (-) Transcript_99222:85-741(-)
MQSRSLSRPSAAAVGTATLRSTTLSSPRRPPLRRHLCQRLRQRLCPRPCLRLHPRPCPRLSLRPCPRRPRRPCCRQRRRRSHQHQSRCPRSPSCCLAPRVRRAPWARPGPPALSGASPAHLARRDLRAELLGDRCSGDHARSEEPGFARTMLSGPLHCELWCPSRPSRRTPADGRVVSPWPSALSPAQRGLIGVISMPFATFTRCQALFGGRYCAKPQ